MKQLEAESIEPFQDGSGPVPLVSVLVLTYQHASFIEACLDGVLMQQCDFPVEILVGEDESSDGTREICLRYAAEHPDRIRVLLLSRKDVIYIHGRPTGRANLLELFRHAKGKYIAFCEGDDHWADPLKLQKQVAYLEAHPDCVMTYHDAKIVDAVGALIKPSKMPDPMKKDHSALELQQLETFVLFLSVVFRNLPVLREMPPEFSKVLNGDNFFSSILGCYGSGHYMAEVEPAVYRVHGGGMWSSHNEEARKLAQMNSWMWMGAYYDRIGRVDLAEYFFERVNKRIKPMSDFYQLRHRKGYQWFVRVMGWFNVSFPK